MKVTIVPAAGAIVLIKLKDGKIIPQDQIERIEVTPFFSMVNGPGEVIYGESSTNSGDLIDKYSIVASGSNGKISKKGGRVEKSVVPLIDRPKPKPKVVVEAETSTKK